MHDLRDSTADSDQRDAETLGEFHPETFRATYQRLRGLDENFARIWLRYSGGLLSRPQLDVRTRLLVLTGQYTMTERLDHLEDTISAAITAELDLKEVLEVIFQCYVYGGSHPVEAATARFVEVVGRAGLLAGVAARGLSVDATAEGRDLGAERATWSREDRDDPRLPSLLERYGWLGPSKGMQLRPGQHVNLISQFDALDPGWCQLWLNMCMAGMYSRGVLDDRTRILCMVGNCLAVNDTYQYPRHMLSALRCGATPQELLEVVLQCCHVQGHPMVTAYAMNDLIRVLDEQGRLDELTGDPARSEILRAVAEARIAGRGGVSDLRNDEGRVRA